MTSTAQAADGGVVRGAPSLTHTSALAHVLGGLTAGARRVTVA